MFDYLVIYESDTGNTKKIATQIFASLPGRSKDILPLCEGTIYPEAKVYFVGFCVHSCTCSIDIGRFLGTLSQKRIALFGTCGMPASPQYYRQLENSALIWIEGDNQYLGSFFCQGKMPLPVRQKLEHQIAEANSVEKEQLQKLLQNFDLAMVHPNQQDLDLANQFVENCLSTPHTF